MESMAMGALVVGLLALVLGGVTRWGGMVVMIITVVLGIGGLVLGIIGLVRIKNGNGDRHGKGLAIAGAVLSPVAVVLAILMNSSGGTSNADSANKDGETAKGDGSGKGGNTSFSSEPPTKDQRVRCANNVMQIGKSLMAFAQDNNDRYPWLLLPRDERAQGGGVAGWSRETSTLFGDLSIKADLGSAKVLLSPLDPSRKAANDKIDLSKVTGSVPNDGHSYGVACGSASNGNAADSSKPESILIVTRNINGPLNNGDSLSDQGGNPQRSTAKTFAIWLGSDKATGNPRIMARAQDGMGTLSKADGSAKMSDNRSLSGAIRSHHSQLGGNYKGSPSGIIDTPND